MRLPKRLIDLYLSFSVQELQEKLANAKEQHAAWIASGKKEYYWNQAGVVAYWRERIKVATYALQQKGIYEDN